MAALLERQIPTSGAQIWQDQNLITKPEAPVVIELDHIHKTYSMGDVEVHALRGVSLTIRKGEFVAIMRSGVSPLSTIGGSSPFSTRSIRCSSVATGFRWRCFTTSVLFAALCWIAVNNPAGAIERHESNTTPLCNVIVLITASKNSLLLND